MFGNISSHLELIVIQGRKIIHSREKIFVQGGINIQEFEQIFIDTGTTSTEEHSLERINTFFYWMTQ